MPYSPRAVTLPSFICSFKLTESVWWGAVSETRLQHKTWLQACRVLSKVASCLKHCKQQNLRALPVPSYGCNTAALMLRFLFGTVYQRHYRTTVFYTRKMLSSFTSECWCGSAPPDYRRCEPAEFFGCCTWPDRCRSSAGQGSPG